MRLGTAAWDVELVIGARGGGDDVAVNGHVQRLDEMRNGLAGDIEGVGKPDDGIGIFALRGGASGERGGELGLEDVELRGVAAADGPVTGVGGIFLELGGIERGVPAVVGVWQASEWYGVVPPMNLFAVDGCKCGILRAKSQQRNSAEGGNISGT